jgi:Mn-dependent DtxR family transcriptional regulator
MDYSKIKEQIIEILKEKNGLVTEEIAQRFNLKRKQVGGIMGALKREGRVFTYTKGYVWVTSGIHSKAAPMGLTNSYYELIASHPLNK